MGIPIIDLRIETTTVNTGGRNNSSHNKNKKKKTYNNNHNHHHNNNDNNTKHDTENSNTSNNTSNHNNNGVSPTPPQNREFPPPAPLPPQSVHPKNCLASPTSARVGRNSCRRKPQVELTSPCRFKFYLLHEPQHPNSTSRWYGLKELAVDQRSPNARNKALCHTTRKDRC